MNASAGCAAHSGRGTRRSLGAVARLLSRSAFLRRGRNMWEKNKANWNLPLSRLDKLHIGAYLILKDYAEGLFPPTFLDQQQAYRNEINYCAALPGLNVEETAITELRKPFWFGPSLHSYLGAFLKLAGLLEKARIAPPAKLLEIGGGTGWTAEFLAQLGFKVVCTTLSPRDVEIALKRLGSMAARGLAFDLHFKACPMETVGEHVLEHCPFDAVLVFEALHHAFDWKAAITSVFSCLRPGGWFLICNEPNVMHTAISYRIARLSNTHEVGFRKTELVTHLRQAGFRRILSQGPRPSLLFRPHWLMAQK